MPTSTSSSSSVHLPQISRRPKSGTGSGEEQEQEQEGKVSESSSCSSLCNMRPQQDPKKVPNGSVEKKKKVVRYRECRKNHAANIGGYAVDGCREFMASGEEGTSAALKCAACNCHRSFHKREVESSEGLCDCLSDSSSRR